MATKITIRLADGTVLELTAEQARQLYDALHNIYGYSVYRSGWKETWREEPPRVTWKANDSFPSLDTVDTTGMGK